MSQELRDLINNVLVKEGESGKARLSMAAKRGTRMIERYASGESNPDRNTSYELALACGRSDEDALRIAKEGSSLSKRTA